MNDTPPTPTTDNPEGYPFNQALEISVVDTRAALDTNQDNFLLIDCREPHELEIAAIEGATHIPMGDIPKSLPELDIDDDTTVAILCRTGRRSLDVAIYMQQQGFEGARSVAGGIHWWSDRLDPTLTKY